MLSSQLYLLTDIEIMLVFIFCITSIDNEISLLWLWSVDYDPMFLYKYAS